MSLESDLTDLRKLAKAFGVLVNAERALASAMTAENAEKAAKARREVVAKELLSAEQKLRDTLTEVGAQLSSLDKARKVAVDEAAKLRDDAEAGVRDMIAAAKADAKALADAAKAKVAAADKAVEAAAAKVKSLDVEIAASEEKLAAIRAAIAKVMG